MPTQLTVIAGPEKGRVFPLTAGTPLSIGRGQNSHTKLTDPHVSRVHCEVRLEGSQAVVIDANSVGGTFVNGQKVANHPLRPGDVIKIGDTEVRFDSDIAEQATLPPGMMAPGKAAKPTVVPPKAPQVTEARPATPEPPKQDIVFAGKAGGRALPRPLQQLHDLVGKPLGQYHLDRVIGTGQIGVVFQATDTRDQKIVALKVLKADFTKDEKARQRFVRSIMTAGSPWNGPRICGWPEP